MSEDDIEIIWMRSVLWIRHPSALKYYCPPPPVSRPSNLYVQRDAAMPLHPLGPAVLLTPPQSQRARTMMDTPTVAGRGHNPHFIPSTCTQTRSPPPADSCLPSQQGEELQWGGQHQHLTATLQLMKLVAAPETQPFSFHLFLKGNISI